MMEQTACGPEQLPTCMREYKSATDDPKKKLQKKPKLLFEHTHRNTMQLYHLKYIKSSLVIDMLLIIGYWIIPYWEYKTTQAHGLNWENWDF